MHCMKRRNGLGKDSKSHVPYDSIYMTFLEKANPQEQNQISGGPGGGGGRRG